MLKLGIKAKDKITGFEGILTGRCEYLTGCTQYSVQPPVKDGEYKNGQWFDETRLEETGPGILPSEVKGELNGGPSTNAPQVR